MNLFLFLIKHLKLIEVFLEFLRELANFYKKFQPNPFSSHVLQMLDAMTRIYFRVFYIKLRLETFQRNIQELDNFIAFYANSQTNQMVF